MELINWNRHFHSSSFLEKGRKTGSKALDPVPRELSKKQKKKKAAKRLILSETRDPKREKLKESVIKRKVDSEELKKFIVHAEEGYDYHL